MKGGCESSIVQGTLERLKCPEDIGVDVFARGQERPSKSVVRGPLC